MKWRIAIKRIDEVSKKVWEPGKYDIVCRKHFRTEDYVEHSTLLGEKKNLKKGAVPSVFGFRPESSPSAKRRRTRGPRKSLDEVDMNLNDIGNEVTVESIETSKPETPSDPDSSRLPPADHTVQCKLSSDRYSIEKFMFKPRAVQYYTSFDSCDHFILFFNILGPAVEKLDYKCSVLSPKNQLFMTLMKLRQGKDDMELAIMFEVSRSVVGQIVNTWMNFLYFQLQEVNTWPSKEVIRHTMPENFNKQFPSTRVILDATEIPIQKPSNVNAQSAIFSTYKNKNTLKTMIGCTPHGVVSYISRSYGGSASDRQIIERSKLCSDTSSFFQRKDSIMADRGIMVQDLFATKDVYVNTPTMLKGKSQLEPEEVVHDRRIASKRIHIEREIGLGKTFKMLKRDLPHSKILMGERIAFICFSINNFRNSIVGLLA
ncbi:uncharacterized protein LOC124152842 [Haliotis rufescens]|uniref:uncharacterized protein LOC124152842 n=1 Tax=Haliotis rufescens TaxID=6454 RepID=UPI00201F3E01|nr:uncharacterized protein LOC124152842 [Haliotis rufescens]